MNLEKFLQVMLKGVLKKWAQNNEGSYLDETEICGGLDKHTIIRIMNDDPEDQGYKDYTLDCLPENLKNKEIYSWNYLMNEEVFLIKQEDILTIRLRGLQKNYAPIHTIRSGRL